jgi:hypothetical protein
MFQQARKYLASITLCLSTAITACNVNAQNQIYTAENNALPQAQLNQQLKYYRDLYPDISFLLLKGGNETFSDMTALDLTLGFQPSSLDYEHPPESREDLMFVSVWRIMRMLQSKEPSASLFKADTPLGWKKFICVLTIDPEEVAADSLRATQHLLALPSKVIQKIPQHMRLTPADYLAFVIDHEIYHCLQSLYVGPQTMSDKPLWADYNHFLNEQGADAYALGMHIKMRNGDSLFARNIQRIRGMSLYNADPNHLTGPALKQVRKIPSENICKMSTNEIFEMANHIRDSFALGYDRYIRYLASSVQAMKEIGVDISALKELRNSIKGIRATPAQVQQLVTNARQCLAELRGEDQDS